MPLGQPGGGLIAAAALAAVANGGRRRGGGRGQPGAAVAGRGYRGGYRGGRGPNHGMGVTGWGQNLNQHQNQNQNLPERPVFRQVLDYLAERDKQMLDFFNQHLK